MDIIIHKEPESLTRESPFPAMSPALEAEAMKVNPCLWAVRKKIIIPGGVPYSIKGHEWQVGIMTCPKKKICVMKGTQLGVSLIFQLWIFHGLIHRKFKQGVMYVFPSATDVEKFSKLRYGPMINQNYDSIGAWITKTDSVTVKRVNNANLVFTGSRATSRIGSSKDSASLRSVEADCIVKDERELHDEQMVEQMKQRQYHSDDPYDIDISSPKIPDHGIDSVWQTSDKGLWMIPCSCGHFTCLEEEFPNCIDYVDGELEYVCVKCRKKIDRSKGSWETHEESDRAGFWISQLNGPKVKPGYILDRVENPPTGSPQEAYNSLLGRPYMSADNRLTLEDVYKCCGAHVAVRSSTETVMGMDVGGKYHHAVIGKLLAENYFKVIAMYRLSSWDEAYAAVERHNVVFAVVDAQPHEMMAKEFRDKSDAIVYLNYYSDFMKKDPDFGATGIVTCNRTEMCDRVHNIITSDLYKFELPQRNREVEIYADQMTQIAKIAVEDNRTNSMRYTYTPIGSKQDHYFHATLYFLLACMRGGIMSEDSVLGSTQIKQKSFFRLR